MITINGNYTQALIYTNELEESAHKQIANVCNHPAFDGCKVRIMPDVHAGAGCVIGFTAEMKTDKVIPNLIGVDIGCGVLTAQLKNIPNFSDFDAHLRRAVPSGFSIRKQIHPLMEADEELKDEIKRISMDVIKQSSSRPLHSIGSLGGGNHFIEIAKGENAAYLCIHSGSRNFGLQIATHYQKVACQTCPDLNLREKMKSLCYLEGDLTEQYLRNMRVAQRYAQLNRQAILQSLVNSDEIIDSFDTVHNYIADDQIIRKGAVQAHAGQKLIVPLNMRDGSVICVGKGNADFNNSAPHGAGRRLSRSKAKEELSMEEFRASMQGIFTTCVAQSTLDEAPMAYKDGTDVLSHISDTANVLERIYPVYNFKAPN